MVSHPSMASRKDLSPGPALDQLYSPNGCNLDPCQLGKPEVSKEQRDPICVSGPYADTRPRDKYVQLGGHPENLLGQVLIGLEDIPSA
jgi:hypothetical protein